MKYLVLLAQIIAYKLYFERSHISIAFIVSYLRILNLQVLLGGLLSRIYICYSKAQLYRFLILDFRI